MIDFKPFITFKDFHLPSVSNWNVGEHIMHCCLVTQAFEKALLDSEPGAKSPSFNPIKFIVLSFGIIPRGKGQAPESVIPEKEYRDEELFQATEEAIESEKRMMAIDPKAWLEHPVFGVLNTKQALKFLNAHNHHHLKIILDIKN